MRQRYHHYTLWEDWLHGMYRRERNNPQRIVDAGNMLADTEAFKETAGLVIVEWRHATEHNLTDRSQNRRSWLGQASAAYTTGATQTETCVAWNTILSDGQRIRANTVADNVITNWYASAFQMEMNYA